MGPRRSSLHSVRFGQLLVTLCTSTHCQCNESVWEQQMIAGLRQGIAAGACALIDCHNNRVFALDPRERTGSGCNHFIKCFSKG